MKKELYERNISYVSDMMHANYIIGRKFYDDSKKEVISVRMDIPAGFEPDIYLLKSKIQMEAFISLRYYALTG